MAQNNEFAGVHVMWVVVQSISGVWIRWLHGGDEILQHRLLLFLFNKCDGILHVACT
jgi:hypothetical protein